MASGYPREGPKQVCQGLSIMTPHIYPLDKPLPSDVTSYVSFMNVCVCVCSGEQALLEARRLWGYGGADEGSSENNAYPEVSLHSATILDWRGETVEELSLSSGGNVTFVSEPFTVPYSRFMVRLRGLDHNGKVVVRMSSFAVQPADVNLALGQLLV